jgi:hypothetical protein
VSIMMYSSSYGSKNQVHGETLMQYTTTNPKSKGGLLPSHGGEHSRSVGEGGEAILAVVPPLIFLRQWPIASCLCVFNLHRRPSQK